MVNETGGTMRMTGCCEKRCILRGASLPLLGSDENKHLKVIVG